ncbi:MAG: hypothetical protein HY587_05235 [Candidatus Omnitrophica bacterium]|nr:hypothetical protein [Candidatus Omnitrophota bacterium]
MSKLESTQAHEANLLSEIKEVAGRAPKDKPVMLLGAGPASVPYIKALLEFDFPYIVVTDIFTESIVNELLAAGVREDLIGLREDSHRKIRVLETDLSLIPEAFYKKIDQAIDGARSRKEAFEALGNVFVKFPELEYKSGQLQKIPENILRHGGAHSYGLVISSLLQNVFKDAFVQALRFRINAAFPHPNSSGDWTRGFPDSEYQVHLLKLQWLEWLYLQNYLMHAHVHLVNGLMASDGLGYFVSRVYWANFEKLPKVRSYDGPEKIDLRKPDGIVAALKLISADGENAEHHERLRQYLIKLAQPDNGLNALYGERSPLKREEVKLDWLLHSDSNSPWSGYFRVEPKNIWAWHYSPVWKYLAYVVESIVLHPLPQADAAGFGMAKGVKREASFVKRTQYADRGVFSGFGSNRGVNEAYERLTILIETAKVRNFDGDLQGAEQDIGEAEEILRQFRGKTIIERAAHLVFIRYFRIALALWETRQVSEAKVEEVLEKARRIEDDFDPIIDDKIYRAFQQLRSEVAQRLGKASAPAFPRPEVFKAPIRKQDRAAERISEQEFQALMREIEFSSLYKLEELEKRSGEFSKKKQPRLLAAIRARREILRLQSGSVSVADVGKYVASKEHRLERDSGPKKGGRSVAELEKAYWESSDQAASDKLRARAKRGDQDAIVAVAKIDKKLAAKDKPAGFGYANIESGSTILITGNHRREILHEVRAIASMPERLRDRIFDRIVNIIILVPGNRELAEDIGHSFALRIQPRNQRIRVIGVADAAELEQEDVLKLLKQEELHYFGREEDVTPAVRLLISDDNAAIDRWINWASRVHREVGIAA